MRGRTALALVAVAGLTFASALPAVAAERDERPSGLLSDHVVGQRKSVIYRALDIRQLSDVIVDKAHAHVLVASPIDDVVLVTGMRGRTIKRVPATDATQLALTPGGDTILVSLPEADAIAAIDADTLEVGTTYKLPVDTCPTGLATAQGLIWYTSVCAGADPAIGVLDPGSGQSHPVDTGLTLGAFPRLDGVAGQDRLVVSDLRSSPHRVAVLEVVGETASPEVARTLTATAKAGSIAVTPDGTHVVVTASHGAVRLSLDDLQADRRFPGTTSNAVAVNDDGRVAVASDVNVSVFLPHLAQPYARVRQTTVTGGLAWNGDGVLMFYKQPGEMTLVIEHPRGQTEIRFKQPVHTYRFGGRSDITVVTNLPRGMPLSVVVRQRGGQVHRLYGITTDRNGTASIDVRVTMSSDVGVVFDGTSLFSRRSGRTSFLVTARITTRMTRAYAHEGRYALYHAGGRDAVQTVHVQANNEGSCVSGKAQIRMNGNWRKYGSADCAHLNAVSRALLSLSSDQLVGSRFRLSAHFDGSESNNAATSRWVYLRFTA